MKTLEYNYRDLRLIDLRYRGNDEKGYYILAFKTAQGTPIHPININKAIFETVLYKYFTPLFSYTREQLFKLTFCAYLSEGHYMQWDSYSQIYEKQDGQHERIYVSRLDIQGALDANTYTENISKDEMHPIH